MTQGTLQFWPRRKAMPGGAKGRAWRLLREGGFTEAHPLVAARLERGGDLGWDPARYIRAARDEQPWEAEGYAVKSRPIGGTGTKPLEGFWVERIDR